MWPDIAGHPVGPNAPVFSIAEIGLNHGGSVDRALAMVDAAAEAGASAIKLQTLYADQLVAPSCPAPAHVAATSLREFFAAFELTIDAHRAIVAHARARGLAVLSTPFCEQAVPMLDALGIDAFKIASGDLTYDGLIAAAASTGKPLFISTGMGALGEVAHAVAVARRTSAEQVAVLHCVSAYPTPASSENLRAIATLRDALNVPVGLSDHSSGGLVSAIAAVALGACVYERHLMLADDGDAIDRAVSSTPSELRSIVTSMECARLALGDGRKRCLPAEAPNVVPSRRGLYATRDIRAGERLSTTDVVALRPATGVAPSDLPALLGRAASRHIAAGEPFQVADLALASPELQRRPA